MKTLLAHEWLAPHGGSENVFEQIHRALPQGDLQCLWNDAPDRFGSEVAETWLAKARLRRSKAASLPFMAAAWRSVDLDPYDQVVASSHAFCHQLASRAAEEGKRGFAYVHTPARYVWSPEFDERGSGRLTQAAAAVLKHQDRRRVSSKASYAANSNFVRERIRRSWDVDCQVIYPPVAVERIQSVVDWRSQLVGADLGVAADLPEHFVLGASRLIEYKRLDLAMKAGEALDLPVVIAGDGPYGPTLRDFADSVSVPVIFTGRVSDELLYTLYQRASLFVFMPIEDFGIMPVEAMALGTPVLVNAVGGAAESVAALGGGRTANSNSTTEMQVAARRAVELDSAAMAAAARQFDESSFREAIRVWTSADA